MSTPHPGTSARPRAPASRGWTRPALWIAAAFGAGLLLSAVWLWRARGPDDFFRAPPAGDGRTPAPLPAPMAGDDAAQGASGMDRSQPLPPPAPPAPPPSPAEPVARVSEPPPPPAGVSSPARPMPGRTPAPRYPMSALRRGEGGDVLVRAEVGPDGAVTSVSLVEPSGNRALDRAALDAVRRWRFEPALRDGVPTVDTVQVPMRFRPD